MPQLLDLTELRPWLRLIGVRFMLRDSEGLLVRLTPIRGLSKEVSRQILCCQWELRAAASFRADLSRTRMHLPQLKRAESRFARALRDPERPDPRRKAATELSRARAANTVAIGLSPRARKCRARVSERELQRVSLGFSCCLLSVGELVLRLF